MPDRIVIAGMGGGFPGLRGWEDAEWWQCKQGYMLQQRIDRMYQMDPWGVWEHRGFDVDNVVAAYARLNAPVILLEHHPNIPRSGPYPIDEVNKKIFGGLEPWYSGVIAYMFAHAIAQGAKDIMLWRILEGTGANDYMAQKANLDFLLGIAMGKGIRVALTVGSQVGKPYSWQPQMYGYDERNLDDPRVDIINGAMRQISEMETAHG